jgi:hypothetical protein
MDEANSNITPPLTMHDPDARMTPEEEFKLYMIHKEGATVKVMIERTPKADGTFWSESKVSKLKAKFNKGYIPALSADKVEKAMDTLMGIGLASDLNDFDAEKSMSRSFKMATRLLEQSLKDAEQGYEIVDEQQRVIPIKTIMECIEKAGRYWTTFQKTKKDSGPGSAVQIDYREMAKIYLEAKAEGVKYDAKGHMKAVLNEVSRQNESLETDEV